MVNLLKFKTKAMFDLFKMMGKFGEIKEKMQKVRDRLSEMEIEEWSDDHLIRITVTASKRIKNIEISPNLLVASAKTDLEKRITDIINTVLDKAEKISKEEIKKEMEGSIPDIPGLDLKNLLF